MTTRRLVLGAITAAALALPFGAAEAADVTLRLHHFLPPAANAHAKMLAPWKEEVEKASNGRIAIEIFPAMQLGGRPPQLIDQARDGVVDIVWTLPSYTPGRYPTVAVFELPFVISNAAGTSRAVQAFYEKHLRDEFTDVHPLMFHVHARGVIHTKNPVEKVDDLAGMKIRAPSRSIGKALEAMGATPVFMPVPALPEALSKGVVDGAVIPWEITVPLKVAEMVDNHAVIAGPRGLYTSVFVLAMNKAKYEAMPADLRAILDEHTGARMAEWVGKVWDEIEAPGLTLAGQSGTIREFSAEQVTRMREVTASVKGDWIAEMTGLGKDGAALLKDAEALIDQYTN